MVSRDRKKQDRITTLICFHFLLTLPFSHFAFFYFGSLRFLYLKHGLLSLIVSFFFFFYTNLSIVRFVCELYSRLYFAQVISFLVRFLHPFLSVPAILFVGSVF